MLLPQPVLNRHVSLSEPSNIPSVMRLSSDPVWILALIQVIVSLIIAQRIHAGCMYSPLSFLSRKAPGAAWRIEGIKAYLVLSGELDLSQLLVSVELSEAGEEGVRFYL